MNHTLSFVRKSKHYRYGTGFTYLHRWPTGAQELWFPKKADAEKYLANLNQK